MVRAPITGPSREAGAGRELPTKWFTEDVNP